jgi:hypothetical protein
VLPPAIVFGLVCLLWLLVLLRPFVRRQASTADDPRERLLEEKRGLLFALRDAEIDFAAGKLSSPDYEGIRTRLEERVSALLARIDALEGGTPGDRVAAALDELRERTT